LLRLIFIGRGTDILVWSGKPRPQQFTQAVVSFRGRRCLTARGRHRPILWGLFSNNALVLIPRIEELALGAFG
jgi:hypothetical protein